MSVTLGLLVVLSGPPIADPDLAPPAAAPPPAESAPTAVSPGPTAAADPSPPAVESTPTVSASPDAEAPSSSVPVINPSMSADAPSGSVGSNEPAVQPQSLRDPFSADEPTDPSEMVGWMGYQSRSVQPLPPPPPPAPPRTERRFFGGYGGPSGRLSSVSRKLGTMTGFRGGVLIGERLSLGAAAYRLTYRHNSNIHGPEGDEYSLRMGYGGMTFGVTLWRPGRIEIAAEGLVGAGVACISDNPRYRDDDYRCVESIKMFVGEPAVTMYVNITDWMRIAVTAGYRLVVREAWRPPNDFILSGGFGGADLQFGWFKKPRRR
jgi:hypothetical protein